MAAIAADDARTVRRFPPALSLILVALALGAAVGPAAAQSLIWKRYMESATTAAAAGRRADAEGLLRAALREAEAPGSNPDALFATLRALGDLCWSAQRYADAEAAMVRMLAVQESIVGSSHPALAASLVRLARTYRMTVPRGLLFRRF